MGNKDKTRNGDATTENRDHSQDQEARDATTLARTIAETVAQQTQSIAEVFARQMEKAHAQYQDICWYIHRYVIKCVPDFAGSTAKQYQETSSDSSKSRMSQTSRTDMTCATAQLTPLTTYGTTPANQNTGMATPNTSMSESLTSSRTTLPAKTTPSTRQPTTVIPQNTSRNGLSQCCMHVHQPTNQVCKPGESLALRKVKHPHNGKTSVSRFPLTKQDILSQYSSCFEGIGHFPGNLYKFHLKPDHKPARHAPRIVPVHLEAAFKEEIESLVKQGILEEVKKHTD